MRRALVQWIAQLLFKARPHEPLLQSAEFPPQRLEFLLLFQHHRVELLEVTLKLRQQEFDRDESLITR